MIILTEFVFNEMDQYTTEMKQTIVNPIAYGGGGFLAHTIRLSAITLELFHLGSPNFMTSIFYSLDTLWRNFR